MKIADIQFEPREDAVIGRVAGEVDMSNAGELASAVNDATPNHVLGVVLDFSGVDYLDSAGIHMVYRLREGLRARGQTLSLVIPAGSPVEDALQLAGVKQHIGYSESVQAALEALPLEQAPEG